MTAAYEYADRQFSVLSDWIGDQTCCLGERFSEADIHVGSVLDWARLVNIDLPANLARYHEGLRMRPAYLAAREANAGSML